MNGIPRCVIDEEAIRNMPKIWALIGYSWLDEKWWDIMNEVTNNCIIVTCMGARLHIYYPHVHVIFFRISMIKMLPHTWNMSRTCYFRGGASHFCSAAMIFLSNFAPHVWVSWPHFWFQIFYRYSSKFVHTSSEFCICLVVPAVHRNCGENGRAALTGISSSRDHKGSN